MCDMTKYNDDHINGVQGDATCTGANDDECNVVHVVTHVNKRVTFSFKLIL